MLASIAAAAVAKPMPLAAAGLEDPSRLVHRHLVLHGRWLPERVVYLDNRPNAGQAGLYVLMPLRLDPPLAVDVIVNRGWIPRNAMERSRIASYTTPGGSVTVTGIALAEEPRLLELTAPVDLRLKGLWQNFDFAAYRRASAAAGADAVPRDTLPVVVRQDPADAAPSAPVADPAASDDAADGLVRSWPDRGASLQGQIDRHHGYAFQWFALAAMLAAIVVFQLVRSFRHGRNLRT